MKRILPIAFIILFSTSCLCIEETPKRYYDNEIHVYFNPGVNLSKVENLTIMDNVTSYIFIQQDPLGLSLMVEKGKEDKFVDEFNQLDCVDEAYRPKLPNP